MKEFIRKTIVLAMLGFMFWLCAYQITPAGATTAHPVRCVPSARVALSRGPSWRGLVVTHTCGLTPIREHVDCISGVHSQWINGIGVHTMGAKSWRYCEVVAVGVSVEYQYRRAGIWYPRQFGS